MSLGQQHSTAAAALDVARQVALDRVTFRKLSRFVGMAIFYVLVALGHAAVMSGRARVVLMAVAGSSAAYAILARQLSAGRVRERWAHPVGLAICAVAGNRLYDGGGVGGRAAIDKRDVGVARGRRHLLELRWWLALALMALWGLGRRHGVGATRSGRVDPFWIRHRLRDFSFGYDDPALLRDLTLETEIRFLNWRSRFAMSFGSPSPGCGAFCI